MGGSKEIDPSLKLLMESGVDVDYPDKAHQTPYLKLYNSRFNEIAEMLRARGANVN